MPPKKKPTIFTLQEAIEYLNSLANAKASLRNWTDALATLVHYVEAKELAFPTTLTKKDMADQYKDVNVVPIINDTTKVIDIIDNKIMSSRNENPISVDTRKQYYLAIIRLTQKGSPVSLPKAIKESYVDKLKDVESQSNKLRNKNEPKRGNALYPNFTWNVALKEYDDFLTEKTFTNTGKGRKDLRLAVVVGMYILQRPRRVADYASLQWYSKKPNTRELNNRNIVYADGDKLYFSIDKFKTRYRVSGSSRDKKELLPRYEKEVSPRLADLLKDYIKKWNVKDMSKITSDERRNKKEFYVFYKETGEPSGEGYDDNSFSKYLTTAFKNVFNDRKKLSVNTFRHMYNTYISENIQQFTDEQLHEIAIDVGDTPRNLPTNLRYRIAAQENRDLEKTQIEGQIQDNEYARNLMIAGGEEGGSVGVGGGDVEDDDEVMSPPPRVAVALPPMVGDADIETLYTQLGRAYMEFKSLELMISKKLGYGVEVI